MTGGSEPRSPVATASLFVTVVLDGVGVGAQPDAGDYGDAGSDTLGHVCEQVHPSLPNLARLGLGNIRPLVGVDPSTNPAASYGRMAERSAGKDSTTGHWELAGLVLESPFPVYPDGFPDEVINGFLQISGTSGVLANRPASGTEVIEEFGAEHEATGYPIVYTSADSVFQVAAHVGRVPLDRLYAWCRAARDQVCVGAHAVGRVIARPFEGSPGAYRRLSDRRKDYSLPPPGPTLLDRLTAAAVKTISVGKVSDLFAGLGFAQADKTSSNEQGMTRLLEIVEGWDGEPTFVWVNLVDFDQDFGHRNDAVGFARALEAFDVFLPKLLGSLPSRAELVITADHGNDPTTPGTDHAREYVPVLYRATKSVDLGIRDGFSDHAATVLRAFGLPFDDVGRPF